MIISHFRLYLYRSELVNISKITTIYFGHRLWYFFKASTGNITILLGWSLRHNYSAICCFSTAVNEVSDQDMVCSSTDKIYEYLCMSVKNSLSDGSNFTEFYITLNFLLYGSTYMGRTV